jgi:hypothetical protein
MQTILVAIARKEARIIKESAKILYCVFVVLAIDENTAPIAVKKANIDTVLILIAVCACWCITLNLSEAT